MKKHAIALYLLMIGLLLSQIQVAKAFQQTYDWHPGGADPNGYQITLISSDNWQVDTTMEITFRLLMTYKNMWLDHTETNKIKIVLSSENFIMDSGDLTETRILQDINDYWEKTISFYIPAEKVNRGQTLDVTITFVLTITQVSNALGGNARLAYTTQNLDNPIHVSIFRPFLSTFEFVVVAVLVTVIVVGGITGFVLFRRKKLHAKHPSPPVQ